MTTATAPAKQHQNCQTDCCQPQNKLFRPRVDIISGDDAVLLIADMPGVDESQVEVTIEKSVLTIRGNRTPFDFNDESPSFQEYEFGNYEREFTISDDIDVEAIEATVKNGVLRLKLPKLQQVIAKNIEIKAG